MDVQLAQDAPHVGPDGVVRQLERHADVVAGHAGGEAVEHRRLAPGQWPGAGQDGIGLCVEAFVEKPDAATAQKYLDQGGYFWNSGMFVLRASVWLKALSQFRPDIEQATRVAFTAKAVDGPFVRPSKEQFAAVPAESIDYAAMERCPGSAFALRMVPLDAGWNDLGAWEAVWQVADKDESGNGGDDHGKFSEADGRRFVDAVKRRQAEVTR